MVDLHFLTAVQLSEKITSKDISCLEMLDLFLTRVEKFNPKLNAIIYLDREAARDRARLADEALAKGESWGPLHGVPMTVKENFNIAGQPSTWGVPHLKNNIAKEDSLAVKRMKSIGVNFFGKTNVPLMLSDWQSFNEIYGTTNNPWDLERTPGGSSGGSAAALAAGMTGLDAGSDIGASIRNPAHYCGVFGHKPSMGILPTAGCAFPGSHLPPDISVIGPLARGAEDLRVATLAMAGTTGRSSEGKNLNLPDCNKTKLSDFKVGVLLEDGNCKQDNELTDCIQNMVNMLAKLGCNVVENAAPVRDTARSHLVYLMLLRAATGSRLSDEELTACQQRALSADPNDLSYKTIVDRAVSLSHKDWLAWNEERELLRREWDLFFEEYDLLITPVAASAAFPHDQKGDRADRTIPVNNGREPTVDQLFWAGLPGVVYLPATAVPAGLTRSGLPGGIQIIGPYLNDLRTIRFARLIEDEIGGFVPPAGYE